MIEKSVLAGIPPYKDWLSKFGKCGHRYNFNPSDFKFLRYHSSEMRAKLKEAYDHVDDIDLYTGAVTEK